MPIPYAGEIAALATAGCWTFTAMSFEVAGRRIGSLSLNLLRLLFAFPLLAGWVFFRRGELLPLSMEPHTFWILVLSGLLGFVFGDYCLFRAIIQLGARTALLVQALSPAMTALLSVLFLKEGLGPWGWVGLALTGGGVTWVVAERKPASEAARITPGGLLLGLGGALGQALGLLLSRSVMEGQDPFQAAQVRVMAGVVGFALVIGLTGWVGKTWAALSDRKAMAFTSLGAFFGPFLGVSGSLAAVRWTDAGTAATIMSIVPILLIPPSILIFKEKVTPRAVFGAIVAVSGVGLMFL